MKECAARAETISEKLSRWSAILFPPALAGVVGGELGPSAGEPHFWDKANHFVAYFVLSVLAVMIFRRSRRSLWAMLGLILVGGALEIIQGLIGRDMSALDELANGLGVLAGGMVAWGTAVLLVRLGSPD
ncbi:MAG TPA: VanZ family protein [Rhizomicrobium sp.]|nr:VanZ family protein [Rhizomicrobium sp.]